MKASSVENDLELLSQHVLKAAQSYFNQVAIGRVWESLIASVGAAFHPDSQDDGDGDVSGSSADPSMDRIEILGLVDFALDFLPVHFHEGKSSAGSKVPDLIDTVLAGLYK